MRRVNLDENIAILRREIDKIDKKLIRVLEKRIRLSQKIIKRKIELGLPITDIKREKEILENLKNIAKDQAVKDSIPQIYELIFKISKEKFLLNKNIDIPFKKIGIIGVGLIGGSILKGLIKNKELEIFGLSKKDKDAKLAYKEGYLKKLISIKEMVENCDLIIIATPINTIIPIAKEIKNIYKKNFINNKILIIDTGSIKDKIVKEFEKLTEGSIEFLGTHPMAGSEKQGFVNSRGDLFLGYPWIISPHNKNSNVNLRKIKKLILRLGSKPYILNSQEHDFIIARVSHLVFLISKLIFIYTYEMNKNWLKYAGTGFKTTTRLTKANPILHFQILENNFRNISKEYKEFIRFLNKFDIKKLISIKTLKKYKKLYERTFPN